MAEWSRSRPSDGPDSTLDSATMKALLSGHFRDLPKCPLNKGCKDCAMFVNDQHSTVTLYSDKVTWWTLCLRSPTPINSYASDSKLVPVSTYTVTTSWLCHRLVALQRAVSFRLRFSFSRPFLLYSRLRLGNLCHVYTTFQS